MEEILSTEDEITVRTRIGEVKIKKNDLENMPWWVLYPVVSFVKQTLHLRDVLHISMEGIAVLNQTPEILAITGSLFSGHDVVDEEFVKKQKQIAAQEVADKFSTLHAQSLIALCGSLEDCIRNFVLSWLENETSAMQCPEVQKMKIELGKYELMDTEERRSYIFETLRRNMDLPLRSGVNQFEDLLKIFRLDGPIDEVTKDTVFEMYQLRNVLVHRSGKADRKLIESCPWLKLKIGSPVIITHSALHRYEQYATHYAAIVMERGLFYLNIDAKKVSLDADTFAPIPDWIEQPTTDTQET